jgi:hypothetical protein
MPAGARLNRSRTDRRRRRRPGLHRALRQAGLKPKPPEDPTSLSAEALEEVETFLAAIDANDDVQSTCTSALAANSSLHDGDRRLTATIDT